MKKSLNMFLRCDGDSRAGGLCLRACHCGTYRAARYRSAHGNAATEAPTEAATEAPTEAPTEAATSDIGSR